MSTKMIQIKLLKDWQSKKAGDIINISEKGAEQFIATGSGEYLNPEKKGNWIDELLNEAESKAKKIGIKEAIAELAEQVGLNSTKTPIFNFESAELPNEIKTLPELEKIICSNFPSIWFEVQACLSAYCSLSLKNLNGCPALNLVGNPSGEKTTALSFFYGHDLSYNSDDFTPKSFVSHATNVKPSELSKIDLLPKLQNKVLITSELAPLFEAPKDDLLSNFAMLTRVLDGEGLNRDSGAQGHRGYSGDYKFVWLGATTPIKSNVWQMMGKMGNRLFFLNMSEKNRNAEDYLKMFSEAEYENKVKICRAAVRSYLNNFFKKYSPRSFDWKSNQQDVFVLKKIIVYAQLLSKLRGSLTTWKSGDDKNSYEFSFPIIEEPPRAINALRNFARGHALICGREFLHSDDLELVRRVCLSSMPHDRYKFLQLLLKHEGKLTTEVISQELNCSADTALRTMKVFEILGVVSVKNLSVGYGRPISYIELLPEFTPLLQQAQGEFDAVKSKSQEIAPVPTPEILDLPQDTQVLNEAVNTKTHDLGGVPYD